MSEQIIINDIDVSLCEYLIKACSSDKEPKCKASTWLRYENQFAFKEYGYCYRCPNCHYKKLQRKIDEYNKIADVLRNTEIYSEVCDTCKDEILTYPSISGRTDYTDNEVDIITLKKIIDRLKYKEQECEELKSQKNILIEGYVKRFKKCHHYEQALDEIKNVWENDEDGDYDFIKFEILDIINKAKDGE